MVYETFVPPATACTPNSMISVMPSDTITIAVGEAPRRWNGVYTALLSSTDATAPAAIAMIRPYHT